MAFNQEHLARMLAQDAFHDFADTVEVAHFFRAHEGFIEAEMHGVDFDAWQGLAQIRRGFNFLYRIAAVNFPARRSDENIFQFLIVNFGGIDIVLCWSGS